MAPVLRSTPFCTVCSKWLIKTVQANLGHATAAFTLDVYGHVTDQMKQESARRMDSYIKNVLGQ